MEIPLTCSECQAIVRELAEAYAEAWDAADPGTQQAWSACQKMIGGTEEDVQRAEELTRRIPPRANFDDQYLLGLQRTPLFRAWQKKYAHESRTRHTVPFRKPW